MNSGVSLYEQKIPDDGFLILYPFSQFMKVSWILFYFSIYLLILY